jgi:hypothetical protein
MRANFIHIEELLRSVLDSEISGDIAEFGVWHGTTFIPMAELARINDKVIHAIDSFAGMAAETSKDGGKYTKGALSVGGSAVFKELAAGFGEVIKIHEGFIPQILNDFDPNIKFCFVHIDLDQYQPTLEALNFIWPRMNAGGIMVCHDWFKGKTQLAAGAINDWKANNNIQMTGSMDSSHCYFIK